MAKLQLSLSTKYVPTWSLYEGVREVIQNALDADQDGHAMSIRHSGKTLTVANTGVRLDSRVWLLGHSSKESGDYRGHYGEGLKLACVALLRAGYGVKIFNDNESWSPAIERSDVFDGAEVLTVYTHRRQKCSGKFAVEIYGVDKDSWELIKPSFLALNPPQDVIKTPYGDVLLGEEFKGQIFVKDIFVEYQPTLSAGYNLRDVTTDRDRRMVSSFDLRYYTSKAWEYVASHDKAKIRMVYDMLKDSSPEMEYFSGSEDVKKGLVEAFKAEYGEKAIAVESMADSRDAEHLGVSGVVLPKRAASVLSEVLGTIDDRRKDMARAVVRSYSWSELTDEEKGVYDRVLSLVEPVVRALGYDEVQSRLNIVDFGGPLDGRFMQGQVQIAKRVLSSFTEALATVVHEVAHARGGDGDVGHERAQAEIFTKIIDGLQATRT